MKKRVMFYCQHVLGMGHLVRSAQIVRGLQDFDVLFLNGGEMVPGFELPPEVAVVNLPPIRSDAEFRKLHTAHDEVSLTEIRRQRRQMILAEYDRFTPDAVIIEMFPLGRRKFAFELIPLLERIRAQHEKTRVVCSLRDILVSKRTQRRFEKLAVARLNKYFDLLLVHSDPQFQRLDETFSLIGEIICPIRYTGFVAKSQESDDTPQAVRNGARIVVSIGGGRVGNELLECAIAASRRLSLPHHMQIFTGPYLPDAQYAQLQAAAAGNASVVIGRYTTQFQAQLRQADLSLSMAGYNTCMDILTSGVRALVWPFTGNNNQEQTMRARRLEALGALGLISPHELTPERLAERITDALAAAEPAATVPLDLNGTERTAELIGELLDQSADGG